MRKTHLLVIDDDIQLRNMLADIADEAGFNAAVTGCPDDFFRLHEAHEPSIVMIDLMMPEMDGVEIIRRLGERTSRANIILMSGADDKVLSSARRLAEGYGLLVQTVLSKPIEVTAIESFLYMLPEEKVFEVNEETLAAAIRQDELTVHYQPKISLERYEGYAVVGAEALVRWHHPEHGIIYPDRFIELAETTNLIEPMTLKVLEMSLEHLARWRDAGHHDLKVAVNLAPQMVSDLALPDRIADMAKAAGVPCKNIVLEITERAAMDKAVNTMDILTRLRLKGFGLSMDDFGVGFSSLSELHRLPFSELKIDRSFIQELGESEHARTIVRALINLAHNLGLSTCAEGVETLEDVEFLQGVECEKCQGFYFYKPMPEAVFTSLLAELKEQGEGITHAPSLISSVS